MSPCRRPHRTNCCASAVPTIYPTLPSKPGPRPVGTEDDARFPASSPCPTCTCATPENRAIVEGLRPASDGDWLIVAGDVAERVDDVVGTLTLLRERFATVVWVPGNHELWTRQKEGVGLLGESATATSCRSAAPPVCSPRRTLPVWTDEGGPAVVAPLFLLYDYSFLPDGTATAEEGLAAAYTAGVVCTDEHLLAPDPYPTAPRGAPPASPTPGPARRLRSGPRRRCWSTTGR